MQCCQFRAGCINIWNFVHNSHFAPMKLPSILQNVKVYLNFIGPHDHYVNHPCHSCANNLNHCPDRATGIITAWVWVPHLLHIQ